MSQNDVDRMLLVIESDIRAINATIRDVDRVRAAQTKLADEAKKMAVTGEQSARRLVKAYADVKKAAEDAAKATTQRQRAAKDLLGGTSTGFGAAGSVLSGVAGSGAAEPLRLAGDVAGLAENLPRLKEGIQGLPQAIGATAAALGPGGIVLGGALLAAGAAFALLTNEINIAKEAAHKRLIAEIDYNKIVGTDTQRTIDLKLEAARTDIDVAQRNVDSAQAAADAAFAKYQEATDVFDKLQAVQVYDQAVADLDTYIVALTAAQRSEANLMKARQDADVVIRSLEEAERKRADALVNTEIAAYQKAAALNSEGAKERLAAIASEIELVERFSQTMGQSDENKAALQARLDNLITEYSVLQSLLPTLIAHNDELERQKKELEESEKTFQATASAMKDFNADITAIEAKTAEQRIAINERLADVAVELAEKQADALASRNDALIEADRDAANERAKNDAQANADRESEQARHNEARKKIDSDFETSALLAEQNRDVLGKQAAELARRAALQEENKSHKDRLSEIDKTLSEQNAAVDDKLREQTDAVEKRYQEQTDAANKASAKQRDALNADLRAVESKYAAEILKRNQANVAELNLINTHYTTRLSVERQYLERLNQQAQQYLFSSTTIAPTQDTGTVIPFASGGHAPGGRTLLVGERGPELIRLPQAGQVFNTSQTRQMMSSGGGRITIPITVNGRRQRDIEVTTKKALYRELDRVLREAGIK